MSHALQGHPRWMGHGGEFWQNVVHRRRGWQKTPVFLPWEPHERYEKVKRYDTGSWAPQAGRCPICYWRRAEKWLQKEWIESHELKWTGMGAFNSDNHYMYYCGQESLRRMWVAIIANERVQNAIFGCNLKNDRMISVHFQGKPFNITVLQVCPNQ